MENIEKRLKEPFKPDEIEWRIGATNSDKTLGIALPYVTSRAIQNRLDEVVGFLNWKNEFVSLGEKSKVCALSVRINNEWITKCDGADDTNIEATKGGLSNAMKRAAVQWGIGRYLYKLPTFWVKIKSKGKSYEAAEIPKLPNWALPENMRSGKLDFKHPEIKEAVPKLSENIQSCIDAFQKIGVEKSELEEYLSLEADTFTDCDIDTLRTVYGQIISGKKQKEDFFTMPDTKPKRGLQTLKLEETLKG